jgi:outer membrane protein assembly factor BamB
VQFAGLPEASDAHRWLGDRALVAGHFERAMVEYERAYSAASDDASLGPRLRLAAAMLGRDAGQPATTSVQFGQASLSASEFESLVAEMRSRGQASGAAIGRPETAAAVPAPARFEVQFQSRLDGPAGERPQEEVGRRTSQWRVPWVDRQLAAAVADGTLYVSNRFHVAAYDLATGARQWQSETPAATMQRAQQLALIPMRPLVHGDRIYVRMLYGANPLLVCLDRSTGKIVWTSDSREREVFASDPLLVQGELVCLSALLPPEQPVQLFFCVFDQRTGEVVRQREIVQLRGSWTARQCCEAAATDDGLVAVLGGATIGVDSAGNLRWARSHLMLPAEEDPRWILQMYERPLVGGNRVYVAQPGVRTVECLHAATGRRYWAVTLPEVVSVVGLAGEVLIVRTEGGVRGLQAADGQVSWRHAAQNLVSFHLADAGRVLLVSREKSGADLQHVVLTWLDAATGRAIGNSPLPALADGDPRLGPIVSRGDGLVALFGRGQFETTRDLIELAPAGPAAEVVAPPTAWHALTSGR